MTGAAGTLGGAGMVGAAGATGAAGTTGAGGRGGAAGGMGGAGGGGPCGMAICASGQICCNASCGVCTAPNGGCTAAVCTDLRWYSTCGQRLCNLNNDAAPRDAGASLPPCAPDQQLNSPCPTLGLECDPRDNSCDRVLACSTEPFLCPF